MNIQWNAKGYKENFTFVPQYGEDVLSLLTLRPGMRVLDLGCGNGALTERIHQAGARVIGMDASPEMLEIARREYPHIPFLLGDAQSFTLDQPVDAVFSNAVFHWVDDQDALLSHVAAALVPGGQLVCEFGGKGCVESVHRTLEQEFARHGLRYPRIFYFPTIGEYAPRMERHGLRVVNASLFDRPTRLSGEDGLRGWIAMFNKKPFEGMDQQLAEEIIAKTVERLRPVLYREGAWYADYVRIRLKAVRLPAED